MVLETVTNAVGAAVSAVQSGVQTASTAYNYVPLVQAYIPLVQPIFQSFQEMKLSIFFRDLRATTLVKLQGSEWMSARLSVYFKSEPPFKDFVQEPEQVSQLKKILNAMYHAECAFKLIEDHPPILSTSSVLSLYTLYSNISTHAHALITIASTIDINLAGYFSGELAQLFIFVGLCQQHAGPQVTRILNGSRWADMQKWAHLGGQYAGKGIDHLHPHAGEVNYRALTRFGGELSNDLAILADHIRGYASSADRCGLTITADQVVMLNQKADALNQALTQLQHTGVSNPLELASILKHPFIYKDILGHVMTLSNSILAQTAQVMKGSEEVIFHQVTELKHKHLFELICLVDKIELFGAFKPGALSKPLLSFLKYWYDLILIPASSIAEIQKKRPDLLVIEDSHFVNARMRVMLERLVRFIKKERKLANVPEAIDGFFGEFEKIIQHTQNIRDCADKPQLLTHYRFIRPFMLQLSPSLDLRIWRDLNPVELTPITTEPPVDLQACLSYRSQVESLLQKAHESQRFYRTLAQDMMESIFSCVNTVVLPYDFKSQSPYRLDESQMLDITDRQPLDPQWYVNQEHLFLHDARAILPEFAHRLYEGYHTYLAKLELAQKTCNEWQSHLHLNGEKPDKDKLRNYYLMLQPYLMQLPLIASAAGRETLDDRVALDAAMIEWLHDVQSTPRSQVLKIKMSGLIEGALLELQRHILIAQGRGQLFTEPTQTYLATLVRSKDIQIAPSAAQRIHHLFSHDRYSTMMRQLLDAFREIRQLFSPPIQAALAGAKVEGTPFPELENDIELLKSNEQVRLLKQLMNGLYYLEDLFKQMELVADTNREFTNAFYMIMATYRALQVVGVMNTVRNDPKLAILFKDVLKRIDKMQEVWLILKPLYFSPSSIVSVPAEKVSSNGMWYSMLAMMVLPEHLKALKTGAPFTLNEATVYQQTAKDTAVRIEKIIAHTDTYTRILLATPDMVRVLERIKLSLSTFSGHTFESVMTHLQSIRDETIPALLIEIDEWELRVGVVPGTLSLPVKKILDQFYLGLIEPLGLPSETHLALASSLASFDVRQKMFNTSLVLSRAECERLEPYIVVLNEFVQTVKSNQTMLPQPLLHRSLRRILPILLEHQERFKLGVTRTDEDGHIDALCHSMMPEETQSLAHIYFLANRCLAYYEGKRNTEQFKQALIEEQIRTIDAQRMTQIAENLDYKRQYITQLLHHQMDVYINAQTDMLSLGSDYTNALKAHLSGYESGIVESLVRASCIKHLSTEVASALKVPLKQFAETDYVYFMKLHGMLGALNAFESYLSQEDAKRLQQDFLWFETETTLKLKQQHIHQMKTIVMDVTILPQDRLQAVQRLLSQSHIQRDLMSYHHYDAWSWSRLKQVFWQLLQAIGLYTPAHEAVFNQLHLASTPRKPVDPAQFLKTCGLFTVDATSTTVDRRVEHEGNMVLSIP